MVPKLEGDTPIESIAGLRSHVPFLAEFDFDAYINIPSQFYDGKFSNQSRKRMLAGYSGNPYRILIPEIERIMVSHDVRTVQFPLRMNKLTTRWV